MLTGIDPWLHNFATSRYTSAMVMTPEEQKKTQSLVSVRPATEEDVPLILSLIWELAEYEKLTDIVVATEESIRNCLFGPKPVAEAIIGLYDGKPEGFAFFFHNCSTFLGRRGLYLEDLYVRKSMRGKGLGKALLAHLAKIAVERGCGRFEWSVLDWNEPAIEFYKSLGAVAMDGWTIFRLTGKALEDAAQLAE